MGSLDAPGQLWLYRTKPQEDELFSSWLVRLAWGLALKLQTFTTQVLSASPGFWTGDVDRRPNTTVLKKLCDGTAISLERAKATGLAEFEGLLWAEYQSRGLLPWVTVIGRRGRRRFMHGQQFCPYCLREDGQPYFRRKWRLAFNVACEKHGIYLSDACPHCGVPVEFHVGDFGERLLSFECPISLCNTCGHDYRQSVTAMTFPAPEEFLIFQRELNKCLDLGWSTTLPGAKSYSHLFFVGFRRLVHLACSKSRFSRARNTLLCRNGMLNLELHPANTSSVFEALRVSERAVALDFARQLLHNWPYDFIDLCQQSRVSSSYLISYRERHPYWFQSDVEWYLDDRDYAPRDKEREFAEAYLMRNNMPVSANSINRLLGVSSVSRQIRHPERRSDRWNPRGLHSS